MNILLTSAQIITLCVFILPLFFEYPVDHEPDVDH